eukprot:7376308-Prymnesium_polylepis.1
MSYTTTLHHVPRESGEESCGAGPASSSQLSGRSAADVSAASVHRASRARRPPPSKERCQKLLRRRSATRTIACGAMEGRPGKGPPNPRTVRSYREPAEAVPYFSELYSV